MKPQLALALLSLALSVSASAQQVVFSDGFETGLTNWTATGLWNAESSTDPCGSLVAPFAEGTGAAWYGSSSSCNYETGGTNSGSLQTNDWIALPNVPSISVHFWMWSESEYCWADSYGNQYDVFSLVVTRQSPAGTLTSQLCGGSVPTSTLLPWHERRFDISAFRGQSVKLRFDFGTGDQLSNGYRGWFVDDVRILAEPGERICPSTALSSGCPCLAPYIPVAGGCRNSTSQSATLLSSGSVSVATDSLQLRVEHMPPNASAILTQSTGTGTPVVFGDGIRCISGQLLRMGTLAAQAGVGTWPVGSDIISVRGMVPAAGGIRYYYVYYRDVLPYCSAATYNLSDTQRITWVP